MQPQIVSGTDLVWFLLTKTVGLWGKLETGATRGRHYLVSRVNLLAQNSRVPARAERMGGRRILICGSTVVCLALLLPAVSIAQNIQNPQSAVDNLMRS